MQFDMEGNMETSHSLVFRGFVEFSAESGSHKKVLTVKKERTIQEYLHSALQWITMDHIGHDKRPIQWEQYRRSWNTHESDCHLEPNHTISCLRGDISGLDSKLYPQIVVGENPSNG